MKHILIYSAKFTGQIALKYDDAGMLISFDATGAQMTNNQLVAFHQRMPFTISWLYSLVDRTGVTVEEIPEDLTFDRFWEAYDRKINRLRCEPLWKKLSDAEKMQALRSLAPYEAYLQRTGYRSKADPEGFLKKKMFTTDWKSLKS